MPRSASHVLGTTVICLSSLCAHADIAIKRWPDDVPCDAIKRSANGSWALTTTVIQGPITRKPGEIFSDRPVTRYWDNKCGKK
jgi:hypothetical protein